MKKTNGLTQGVIQLAVNLGILVIVILGLSVLIKSDKLVARAGIIAAAAIILTLFQVLIQRGRKDEKEEIVACMEEIADGKENVICMVEDEEVAKAVEAVKEKVSELSNRVGTVESDVKKLQAEVDTNENIMTLKGFCSLHKIILTKSEMQKTGFALAKKAVKKVQDSVYGQVNQYYITDLENYFSDLL